MNVRQLQDAIKVAQNELQEARVAVQRFTLVKKHTVSAPQQLLALLDVLQARAVTVYKLEQTLRLLEDIQRQAKGH